MFDPKAHLITLPRRVKDPQTGQWSTRLEDYLQVRDRLRWYREAYPHGTVETEAMRLEWESGVAIFKATVTDGEGGKATGYGTETRKSFEDFVEKAETRAIGRALGILGFGTQFCGEELSEGEHVADAPVAPPPSLTVDEKIPDAGIPVSEQSQALPTAPPHPTAEQVEYLFQLAESCREPKEAFGSQLRRIMQLDGSVRISKKFLRETMSLAHYAAAEQHYTALLKSQVEDDVPTHTPPEPPEQETPQVPFASSSAPDAEPAPTPTPPADPGAEAKAKLRAEVAGWTLPVAPNEVEYILNHYAPVKARALLWGARRPKPVATPIEAAAD